MEPDFVVHSSTQQELSAGLLTQEDIHNTASSSSVPSGEKQPQQYRDVWAAILFVAVQFILVVLLFTSGGDGSPMYIGSLARVCTTSSIVGLVLSVATLNTLLGVAQQLVYISLFASVLVQAGLTVYCVVYGYIWFAIAGMVGTALNMVYSRAIWRRIPVASAHLHVAAAALSPGVCVAAYGMVAVALLYSSIWGYVVLRHTGGSVTLVLLLLVYAWTGTVLRNILHVTAAGTVGTFVFCPNDVTGGLWSLAVSDALVRACTFSLGSICLGSLLTAILTVAYQLVRVVKRAHIANEWLTCVLECVTGFLERVVVYFNKYAYVYVALYGYDYLTAGQKVAQLLNERGMSVMINDDLVQRALMLVGLMIGCITGAVGYAWEGSAIAFTIPFCTGVLMSGILLSVVSSAVDTVVVSYAEAPLEIERNHPGLAARIKAAYRQVYPDAGGLQ